MLDEKKIGPWATKRPTHVMVYDEESQTHEPMTLEDFAALFMPGAVFTGSGATYGREERLLVRAPSMDTAPVEASTTLLPSIPEVKS